VNLFFDTSALVKYFHDEPGSRDVRAMVDEPRNTTWLLDLASTEFQCSLYRRLRNHELSEADARAAIAGFEERIADFSVEPLTAAVLAEARQLMRRWGRSLPLRTLDALHLAAYSLISESTWRFVVADLQLAASARTMGFHVIVPDERQTN
jgi:predicted nucleic acid-binding protein